MLKEFRDFVARGNVLDLAVAVIIGAAFATITTSLTDDIIMPVVGAIFGGMDFSSYFVLLGPVPDGAQARAQGRHVPVHRGRGGGIEPEHAVQGGRDDVRVGLPGVRDPPHLAQRLGQAGERQHAILHRAHAAAPATMGGTPSSGASVDAITAPPRHASPS